jgi:hypothetical protein
MTPLQSDDYDVVLIAEPQNVRRARRDLDCGSGLVRCPGQLRRLPDDVPSQSGGAPRADRRRVGFDPRPLFAQPCLPGRGLRTSGSCSVSAPRTPPRKRLIRSPVGIRTLHKSAVRDESAHCQVVQKRPRPSRSRLSSTAPGHLSFRGVIILADCAPRRAVVRLNRANDELISTGPRIPRQNPGVCRSGV